MPMCFPTTLEGEGDSLNLASAPYVSSETMYIHMQQLQGPWVESQYTQESHFALL